MEKSTTTHFQKFRCSCRSFTHCLVLFCGIFLLGLLDSGPREVKGDFLQVPITFILDNRDWKLPESEPVGSRVARVRTSSESRHLNVTFRLESNDRISGPNSQDFAKLFRIDKKTGAIYLNESLQGKKGQRGSVFVTGDAVNNNEDDDFSPAPTSKIEVHIQIVGDDEDITDNHFPNFQHPFRRPLPPYNYFPGQPQNTPIPLPPGFTFNNQPSSPSESPTVSSTTKSTLPPTVAESPENVDLDTNLLSTTNTTLSQTASTLSPITSPSDLNFTKTTTTTNLPEWSNEIVPLRNGSQNGVIEDQENGTIMSNVISTTTIIPVVVIISILLIILALLLLQKRIKYKNDNSKRRRPVKEIRKGSSLSATNTALSSGSRGDDEDGPPTLSSALAQWIGKRAESNRYEESGPQMPYDGVICTDSTQQIQRDPWEFPRHHLKIIGILGEGCFGQVWRCEALNLVESGTKTVAVKTLKESAGDRERADLVSELAVMKMLDPHPNVVRLLGCCTEKDPLFVIMEYVSLGKLQAFLRNSRAEHYYGNLHSDSGSLSSKDLTSFAYQVARGMDYLAGKGIIHRDLAARNILIDKDRTCKVADFGFARDVVDNHVYERKSDGRLPIRWMAPEALFDNIFTTKTDVWSFGVLMWEIVTLGSTPYPGLGASDVMRKVRDGYRLEKPEHCRRELYNIMFYCWAHNADDRPSFVDLVNFLGQLLFSETDYIELDRFPEHSYYNLQAVEDDPVERTEDIPEEKL